MLRVPVTGATHFLSYGSKHPVGNQKLDPLSRAPNDPAGSNVQLWQSDATHAVKPLAFAGRKPAPLTVRCGVKFGKQVAKVSVPTIARPFSVQRQSAPMATYVSFEELWHVRLHE